MEAAGEPPESAHSPTMVGTEIRRLREEYGIAAEPLARVLGFSRKQLSALENGRVGPDIDLVSGICEYLGVGTKRRAAIMDAATDGWTRGWWTADAEQMGARQALYADLESGTDTISEYVFALFPGLLQTPAFADARLRCEPARHGDHFDPAAAVAARATRQQLLLAPDGPRYDVVLDEAAVRRCAAEPHIVAEQLRHLVAICSEHPNVTVRVLPIGAPLKGHSAPRSAYSIYRYRDPQRSVAVAVDTLTEDRVHTEPAQIDPDQHLHARLKAAALDPAPSLHTLAKAAQNLTPMQGVAA
ncbi:helix-turn-helix domain-containing protein [Dactylosporangium sp. CS-047395]|uniref:helix-turn-helix domain-containing protein n=1 Tax=Dactylosporangium sp. CS-047395 TaxID=3239936 RepID=UPI003D9199C8